MHLPPKYWDWRCKQLPPAIALFFTQCVCLKTQQCRFKTKRSASSLEMLQCGQQAGMKGPGSPFRNGFYVRLKSKQIQTSTFYNTLRGRESGCVCVHVYTQIYTGVFVYTCVDMGGCVYPCVCMLNVDPGGRQVLFLRFCIACLWRAPGLASLELNNLPRLAGHWGPGICLPPPWHPTALGLQAHSTMYGFFMWVLVNESGSSGLYREYLTH